MHSGPGPSTGPGPVLGPWAREKLSFRDFKSCQRSPRCSGLQLQRVIFAKLDFPEMHYHAVRSREGSRWTIMHLGEVEVGKKSGLWLHFLASRGGLADLQMHDCHWKIVELRAESQNTKCAMRNRKTRESFSEHSRSSPHTPI